MNSDELFKTVEAKANKFNIYCLMLIMLLGLVVVSLNDMNIFSLNKPLVRTSMLLLMAFSAVPCIIWIINDIILKKEISILLKSYFKIIIIISSFISIMMLCVALSFHATLLLVIPTLLAAQYKKNNKTFVIGMIASLVLTVVSVYGSFLFGVYDANLLKPLSKEEATIFSNRVDILKSERAFSVFFHYALPRMLGIVAIDFIGFSITRRTSDMLDTQIVLSNQIKDEILAKTRMQNGVIEHLADIIESRDIETGEHIKRNNMYVTILVKKMKDIDPYKNILNPNMCEYIINAAPLHDIGKIAVSDLILCKPGRLTDEEFEKMKLHTIRGGEIVNNILNELGSEEFLKVAYEIAISHHEKWNGTGYPYGLKEEEIPLPGRIMAIADVFDALVAERVYKKPIPIDEAITIIIKDSGTHFDPNLIDIFKEVTDEFKETALSDL